MTYLTFRDKVQTQSSDTGGDVRHVTNGEELSQAVLQRPSSNLERRTTSIQEYLHEEMELRRAFQSRNISLVEVSQQGTIVAPGMLRIHKEGASYFVTPGHLRGDEATRDYRVLVTSGIDGLGTYCLKREAFTSFYTDSTGNNNNTAYGLSSAGDTVSLRVPRKTTEETNSSLRDLVDSNSSAVPYSEAVVGSSLSSFILSNSLGENQTGVLVKSPALNRVSLVFTESASDLSALEAYLTSPDVPDLSLEVVDGNSTTEYTVDHRDLEYDTQTRTLLLYSENYNTISSADLTGTIRLFSQDSSLNATFAPADVATSVIKGTADPYNELIPLFYHAGDRLVVSGVGSVLLSEIDNIDTLGFPVLITGDGRVVSTYTLGQVQRVSLQRRIQAPVSAVSVQSYSTEIELLYDPTKVDSGYVIDTIEVLSANVPGGVVNTDLKLEYLDAQNSTPILLNSNGNLYLPDIVGGVVSPESLTTLIAGRTSPTIASGEKLKVTLYSTSADIVDLTNVTLRVNLVEQIVYS